MLEQRTMPTERRLMQRDHAWRGDAQHSATHKLISPFHNAHEDVLASSRTAREQRRVRRQDGSRNRINKTGQSVDRSPPSGSLRSPHQHLQLYSSAALADATAESSDKENTFSRILTHEIDTSAREVKASEDDAVQPGPQWGANVDDRLKRLEQQLHRVLEHGGKLQAQVDNGAVQARNVQRDVATLFDIAQDKLRARDKASDAHGHVERDSLAGALDGAPDALSMAGQLRTMQGQFDQLERQFLIMLHDMRNGTGIDLESKIVAAVTDQVERIDKQVAELDQASTSRATAHEAFSTEARNALESLRMRMDDWEIANAQTEQTLMSELGELQRVSTEVAKRLANVESDYQLFITKDEHADRRSRELEEQFADFDGGIATMTQKLEEYQSMVGRTKGACDHLLTEQNTLQMATASLRAGLDQTAHEMRTARDELRQNLSDQATVLQEEAAAEAKRSQAARNDLREKLHAQIDRKALECNASMASETGKVADRAAELVAQLGMDLKDRLMTTKEALEAQLAKSGAKVDEQHYKMRLEAAAHKQMNEKLMRDLAQTVQDSFQEITARTESTAEQLARNAEAMGEEIAQRAEASLRELANRVMESEIEAEMSKLFLRTAVERSADDLVETRRELKVELARVQHEMAELNMAQTGALQAALEKTGKVLTVLSEQLESTSADLQKRADTEEAVRKKSDATLQSSIEQTSMDLEALMGAMAQMGAETETQFQHMKVETADLLSALQEELIKSVQNCRSELGALDEMVVTRFSDVNSATTAVIQTLTTGTASAIQKLQALMTERCDEMEATNSQIRLVDRVVDRSVIMTLADELREHVGEAVVQLRHELLSFHDQIEKVDLHHFTQGLTMRAVLETEVEEVNERVETIAMETERLRADAVVMMEEKIGPCEAQIEMLRTDTSAMLEKGIKPCEQRLVQLQIDVTDTSSRLDGISQKTDDLSEQCAWAATTLHEETTDRELLSQKIETVQHNLEDVEAACVTHRASIESSMNVMEQKVANTIQEKVDPCVQHIADIRSEIGTKLRQEVDGIDQRLSQVVEEMNTTVVSQLSTCSGEISNQETKLDAIRSQVSALSQQWSWTDEMSKDSAASVTSRVDVVEGAFVDFLETVVKHK
eukprot:SAG31_NODE_3122_length_4652_cov_2.374259_1_plen_1125_part_00